VAYFYAYVPNGQALTLARIVQIAGYRWMVEEDFQQSKGQVGLDHSQVRRYRSWRRHTILAIAAHAIHAVTAARQRQHHPAAILPTHGDDTPPPDCGQIALTVPETHRLFILHDETRDLSPASAARRVAFHERWSTWRRRHQARARWFHCRKRLASLGW
jgi:hypothetical protein